MDRFPANGTSWARRPVLSVLFLGLFGAAACGGSKAPAAPPPPEVSVVTVTPRDVEAHYEFVGQAEASKKVEVRSLLPGVIIERPYVEGTDVPKGAVLFRIDPTTYEAVLRSAEAQLKDAEARLTNADRNLRRLRPLLAERAVAQKDVDDAETEAASARAAVDQARAAVDKARKDYDDTWVRAEIGGRVGRALLVLGARVAGPNDILTTVEQIDPIYVNFSPSDQEVLRWRSDLAAGRLSVAAGVPQDAEVTLSDGSTFPEKGRVSFADISLQPQTGTLQLRAEFRNPARTLLPGQFVRVHILGVTRKGAVLVPQRAIQQGLTGSFVYVVDQAGKATARDVTLGPIQEGEYVIESGLAAGDRVVVDGAQKVVAGQPVRVGSGTPAAPAQPAKGGK